MSTQQTTDADLIEIAEKAAAAADAWDPSEAVQPIIAAVRPIIEAKAKSEGRREGRLEAVRHLIYLAQQHPDGTVNIPTMEIEIEDDTGAAADREEPHAQ